MFNFLKKRKQMKVLESGYWDNAICKKFEYNPPVTIKEGQKVIVGSNGDLITFDDKGKEITYKAKNAEE